MNEDRDRLAEGINDIGQLLAKIRGNSAASLEPATNLDGMKMEED